MWSKTWQAYASLTYLEASSLSLDIETQLTYTAWALINFQYQLPLEVSDKMHSLFESKNWFIRVVHTLQLNVSFTSLPHTVVCHSCLFINTIVAYLYARINTFWENFSTILVYTTITHILYKETPSQPFYKDSVVIHNIECKRFQNLKCPTSMLCEAHNCWAFGKLVTAIARIRKWEQSYSIYQETRNNQLETSILCS